MSDKELFKLWAPRHKRWVDWVKPVVFTGIERVQPMTSPHHFVIPAISAIDYYAQDTAIIVDLPTHQGVTQGLAYAKLGYRPIPLYNGTTAPPQAMALVDQQSIQSALVWGASKLNDLAIKDDAAPVFLVDSHRIFRFKMEVSIFDNSWDLYDQDIPSPEYFLKNGIHKIIVRGDKIQRDLGKILYKFQKKGITIFFTDGHHQPQKIRIKKPPRKDKFH